MISYYVLSRYKGKAARVLNHTGQCDMEPRTGLLYLIGKLGWRPRPGLDLDAGIRLQAREIQGAGEPVINAVANQYSAGSMGMQSRVPSLNHLIVAKTMLSVEMPGPNSGQVASPINMFPWTNPPIQKKQ